MHGTSLYITIVINYIPIKKFQCKTLYEKLEWIGILENTISWYEVLQMTQHTFTVLKCLKAIVNWCSNS